MASSTTSKVMSLSLARGVLMVVSVVSGMVFARTLSVADYGTYLQTFLAYDFAVPILTMGLPSALFYFLPGEKKRQKGLVLDNLLLLFVAAVVFSLFLLLGGTELLAKRFNNPELSKTLRWMVLYPLYTFPVLLASAVWVVKDKVKLNAIYNVVTGLTLTISLIIAASISKSYEIPTLVKIITPILFLPFALYLIFKNVEGKWDIPRISTMWHMVKFSVPLGLASVLGTITIQLSSIVVSLLTSPEDYAIYANGAKEVPIIGIVTGSISVVIMADMAKSIKADNYKKALEQFRRAAAVSASFLLPTMVFLMIFAEYFINILYSTKYEASVLPFRIYLFMLPVRIVYYGSAFIALGKTKAILFRSFIELILTAFFAYFLTKHIGYIGAAIATVSMYYIWAIPYNLNFLGKAFSCKPTYIIPFKQLGKVLSISVIAGAFASIALLIKTSPIIVFMIGGMIFSVLYILISYNFNQEFREFIIPFKNRLPWVK